MQFLHIRCAASVFRQQQCQVCCIPPSVLDTMLSMVSNLTLSTLVDLHRSSSLGQCVFLIAASRGMLLINIQLSVALLLKMFLVVMHCTLPPFTDDCVCVRALPICMAYFPMRYRGKFGKNQVCTMDVHTTMYIAIPFHFVGATEKQFIVVM